MYMYKNRNIVTSILLTLVTCGLYGIYWLACLADDLNAMEENREMPSGGMVVLLSLITCGLYQLYFMYMAGKRMYALYAQKNMYTSDNAIVYLLLVLGTCVMPGAYIVAYAILQNDINRYLDMQYANH